MKVSVILITLNEETAIARCLESVSWADEILAVDGGSHDRTVEILRNPGAPWASKIRVIENPWPGFRAQRTLSLESAKHDWVLVIDSDEACSPELAERIRAILATNPAPAYYKVRRQEYFLGKPIRYGIWNPSYQDRFFHRAGVQYINEIHEYPKYPAASTRIEEPLHHWPDLAIEKVLDKMNRYTTIEARDRFQAGRRTNAFRMIMAFPAMFLKNYFYYRAWKDGVHGFAISILEGVSRAVRHLKLWQLGMRERRKT